MEFRANQHLGQPAAQPRQTAGAGPAGHSLSNQIMSFLKRRWWIVLLILAVIGLLFLGYGYIHTKNELTKLKNPSTAGKTETQQVIDKVGKLVQLPSGETPTLATVNDATKLKNQAFFAGAQNGDKVLIYSKAGKAVLYRPSTNKIIAYSPVNLGNQ